MLFFVLSTVELYAVIRKNMKLDAFKSEVLNELEFVHFQFHREQEVTLKLLARLELGITHSSDFGF